MSQTGGSFRIINKSGCSKPVGIRLLLQLCLCFWTVFWDIFEDRRLGEAVYDAKVYFCYRMRRCSVTRNNLPVTFQLSMPRCSPSCGISCRAFWIFPDFRRVVFRWFTAHPGLGTKWENRLDTGQRWSGFRNPFKMGRFSHFLPTKLDRNDGVVPTERKWKIHFRALADYRLFRRDLLKFSSLWMITEGYL